MKLGMADRRKCGLCGKPLYIWWVYNHSMLRWQISQSWPTAIYIEHGLGWICKSCLPKHPPKVKDAYPHERSKKMENETGRDLQSWISKTIRGWESQTRADIPEKMKDAYREDVEFLKEIKKIVGEWLGLQNWTCTFREYYALPEPIRNYIAALETNADPPSMVRENIFFKETIAALERKNELLIQTIEAQQKLIVTMTEIENAVGDTSDEYTEGVVELFESKGFEVLK